MKKAMKIREGEKMKCTIKDCDWESPHYLRDEIAWAAIETRAAHLAGHEKERELMRATDHHCIMCGCVNSCKMEQASGMRQWTCTCGIFQSNWHNYCAACGKKRLG